MACNLQCKNITIVVTRQIKKRIDNTSLDGQNVYLLIATHDKEIAPPTPLQTCHNNSPTIAQHVTVCSLLTISLQLDLVQFCFRSDKHCSVEHPSISTSVGTGELSVVVYCQFQNIHITYVYCLFDMFKTGYCCVN